MIQYSGIHHLAMATPDLETTIRYWRDLLGMRLVGGFGRPGYRHYFFEISKTDMIAFFEWPEVDKIPPKDHGAPVKGPFAFDHIAIGVDRDDDLWELKDRLEAAGFWVSEVVDHGFIHSLYTFDPNQIPIEFSAPVAGKDLRESPILADRHPVMASLEGDNPQQTVWPEVALSTPLTERIIYPGEGWSIPNAVQNKENRAHSKLKKET